MIRTLALTLSAALLAGPALIGAAPPAAAQSTGYVTGIPGPDPAADDEIGWGPAYRPETSFAQPGTPRTPGQIAGDAYRARTGRGPYDAVQAPLAAYARPAYDRAEGYVPRRVLRHRAVVHRRVHQRRRVATRRLPAY